MKTLITIAVIIATLPLTLIFLSMRVAENKSEELFYYLDGR